MIFGLGNLGDKFLGTRHNLGAETLRAWEKQAQKEDLRRVSLVYPQGYMNDSGMALVKALGFSSIDISEVLIIHDDVELPLGEVKLVVGGSAKGHNGVRSVYKAVGDEEVTRLRIGLGRPPEAMETRDFVLGAFNEDEKNNLRQALPQALKLIDEFIGRP